MKEFKIGDNVEIINGSNKGRKGIITETMQTGFDDPINNIPARIGYKVLFENSDDDIITNDYNLKYPGEDGKTNIFKENLEIYMNENENNDYDEAFMEMAGRIPGEVKIPGKPKKHGLIIAVGADEQTHPHFHVFKNENDKKKWEDGACLFFTGNKYYDHGKNRETLDKDELNAVIKNLRSMHKNGKLTNWEYLVSLWNDNNYRYEIDYNIKMPEYNYNTIKRYKDK